MRRSSKGTIVRATMNFCTSAIYHVQRPHLCAGHGQRHRPIKVGMAMRQLKLRSSAGPSSRRPDASHATWTRARPAWPAPVRWLGQRARWWAAGPKCAHLGPLSWARTIRGSKCSENTICLGRTFWRRIVRPKYPVQTGFSAHFGRTSRPAELFGSEKSSTIFGLTVLLSLLV